MCFRSNEEIYWKRRNESNKPMVVVISVNVNVLHKNEYNKQQNNF